MATQELKDFQDNLQETEDNVQCVREKVETAQDINDKALKGLKALDATAKAVAAIDAQILQLQNSTSLATKVPPIAGGAKTLDRLLDRIGEVTGRLLDGALLFGERKIHGQASSRMGVLMLF